MLYSTRIVSLPLLTLLTVGVGTARAEQRQQPASARPIAAATSVDPLIGTWSLNVSKSQFPGTPPLAVTRTFDYTIDGMILVAYETTSGQGNKSFVHWFLGLDGKEHPEFERVHGATATWYLSAKVIDTHTKEIVDRRIVAPGAPPQVIHYTFQVSPDGKTFTSTGRSTNAKGEPTLTVQVYDRVF